MNGTLDWTAIDLTDVPYRQGVLEALLHEVRRARAPLCLPNKQLGEVFDQVKHLDITVSNWWPYWGNILGPMALVEDSVVIIRTQAIKSLFPLAEGAVV